MSPFHRTRTGLAVVALALLLAGVVAIAFISKKQNTRADILWNYVHGRCVPDMLMNHVPAPCVSVDLTGGEEHGFVVWKDSAGNSQYLVMPTKKITGIESPAILLPDATNYFADAWMATTLVDQRVRQALPRANFALAINSVSGRSQDQLHIHIDCVQPNVKSSLEQVGSQIGTTWQSLPVKLAGHNYRAMWIPGGELGERNPFRRLADSLSYPAQEMAAHTLVLVGAERNGQPGFILLDGKVPFIAVALSPWIKLGLGSGEELEDHSCQVAHGAPTP
jgi:CDP-diacylglycerol pyrophosphatase